MMEAVNLRRRRRDEGDARTWAFGSMTTHVATLAARPRGIESLAAAAVGPPHADVPPATDTGRPYGLSFAAPGA